MEMHDLQGIEYDPRPSAGGSLYSICRI